MVKLILNLKNTVMKQIIKSSKYSLTASFIYLKASTLNKKNIFKNFN